jgi:hypothetical protein
VIKGTKLDFYSVASPSPFVHRQITWKDMLVFCRYKLLPNRRGGVSGFGMPPASRRAVGDGDAGGGRHAWGEGHRLDADN